jgi:hypothetical protein
MSKPRYRSNPDFVPQEPTPADLFNSCEDPGTPEGRMAAANEMRAAWGNEVAQIRLTWIKPGDGSGYPPGLWLEGWKDPKARQLPFGAPWPTPESGVWPPLVAAD